MFLFFLQQNPVKFSKLLIAKYLSIQHDGVYFCSALPRFRMGPNLRGVVGFGQEMAPL